MNNKVFADSSEQGTNMSSSGNMDHEHQQRPRAVAQTTDINMALWHSEQRRSRVLEMATQTMAQAMNINQHGL